jgi:dTDP-4-amino-4,6-dideoxygalactose transaminase
LASAITDNTLCIVVCHLFGYPADLDTILKVAKVRQIPVIDDAAQAMGACYKEKLVGTFGIAGLFSLSRGKNITAVDGGIVVTNDDSMAEAIAAVTIEPVGLKDYLVLMLKAVALCFMLHPRCYWLPRSMPLLNIGASHFNPEFAVQRFTAFQAGIAQRMLNRMEQINSGRRDVAEKLTRLLTGNKSVVLPKVVIGCEPVFLRFPVIGPSSVENPELGVVRSYPATIRSIPGIKPYLVINQDFTGAELLADRILTLPTHCYVTDADCIKAASLFPEGI